MRKIISIISIVFLGFQACFAQNLKFESLMIKEHKMKFDNVDWKFQKGESFTRSNFDLSDSAAVINLLLNVEKNNYGFHIPTSSELFLFGRSSIIFPERKVKCDKKSLTCKEINNVFIFADYLGTSDESDNKNIWKILLSHSHPCPNCESASKEYKKICPKCKGTNKNFCNKSIKCPKCNGTGSATLASKKIAINEVFKNEVIFFYFNSLTDFGLYDVKNLNKIALPAYNSEFEVAILAGEQQIESSIKKHKIFQEEDNKVSTVILKTIKDCDFTKARNQISKLNFPDKFPYYTDLKNKEDSVLISKIGLDLINISPIEAANKFKDLDRGHKEFKRLKEEIQNSLNEYSKNVKDTINKQAFDKFVKENAESLTQLPLGKHILKSNNNGRYLIDNNTEKIYVGKLEQISELKYGDFVVKIPSEKSFEITTNIEKTGNWIYATRQWRNLYKNNYNNKLYRREFKNCSSFATVYDRKCPRNRVFVIQPQKYVTHIETSFDKPYAENFSIAIAEEQAEPKIMEKIKIHRKFHIGTLGMMTILMAVPSYWLISRKLEIKNIQ